MRILIGCENSNTVAKEFRKRGHTVISCDLLPNDESQENHYQGDVRDILYEQWDMGIFFPPCTDLAASGARHFAKKRADGRQKKAIEFFMMFTKTKIPLTCIENPIGIMSNEYRKPDQIIQPWQFGDTYTKTTCLWLTGLPKLFHAGQVDLFNDKVTHVGRGEFITIPDGRKVPKWYSEAKTNNKELTQKIRSKTFPGIAKSMAEQWSFEI